MQIINFQEILDLQSIFNQFENSNIKNFQILTQIGQGSFANVYKVQSNKTQKIYAAKVILKQQILQTKLIKQLKTEILILSKCNHPNIIKLFTAFEDDDKVYLITEYANQGTLFNKLHKVKQFDEDQTRLYLQELIQAFIYLHSQKPPILHRDLKPENILINDGHLKIADFGWSNQNDNIRNTFCGTYDYLSPEMILGNNHDEKLDIWTLGILMYELLHGKPPFSPDSKVNNRRMYRTKTEKNILDHNIEFGDHISDIAKSTMSKLLNPNPELRPTAQEILNFEFIKINNSQNYQKLYQELLIKHQEQEKLLVKKQGNINMLFEKIQKLDSENQILKIKKNQESNPNQNFKPKQDFISLKKEEINSKIQNKFYQNQLKNIQSYVQSFHDQHYQQINFKKNQFQFTQLKKMLENIFNDYEINKNQKRSSNVNDFETKFTASTSNNQRYKREIQHQNQSLNNNTQMRSKSSNVMTYNTQDTKKQTRFENLFSINKYSNQNYFDF